MQVFDNMIVERVSMRFNKRPRSLLQDTAEPCAITLAPVDLYSNCSST